MSKKNHEQDQVEGVEGQVTASTLDPEAEAKAKAKAEARKAAKSRVLKFLTDNKEQLGSLVDDIMLFVGKAQAARPTGVARSINTDLREALIAAGETGLTELDVFRQFKIGRPEMVTKCRILVLCPNPADRVWVKFFEDSETYKVVGTGENPPEGWDGYVPSPKALGL